MRVAENYPFHQETKYSFSFVKSIPPSPACGLGNPTPTPAGTGTVGGAGAGMGTAVPLGITTVLVAPMVSWRRDMLGLRARDIYNYVKHSILDSEINCFMRYIIQIVSTENL